MFLKAQSYLNLNVMIQNVKRWKGLCHLSVTQQICLTAEKKIQESFFKLVNFVNIAHNTSTKSN